MAPIPTTTIAVRDIIDGADVRKLAGGVTRKALMDWRNRADFPKPIKTTGGGTMLYDRRQIRAWLQSR